MAVGFRPAYPRISDGIPGPKPGLEVHKTYSDAHNETWFIQDDGGERTIWEFNGSTGLMTNFKRFSIELCGGKRP